MATPPMNDPSALGKTFLLPPNELVTGPLFERLREKLQLSMDKIINTIDSPTEEAVKDLLWSIVSKLEARMDNVYPESGLHSALESAFRATVGYRGDYTVHSECPVDGRGDFAQKFDLLLKHNKNSLLLELKRLRPNGICVPNTGSNFHDVSTSTRLLHFKQFTENISADVLRTYRISQLALDIWNSKGVRWPVGTTVADVESSAQRQALNYKRLLSKKDPSESIRAFSVVQVGWPLLVKEIQENQ